MATDIHACFRNIVLEIKRLQEPRSVRASIETFSGWITDSSGGQIVLNTKIDKEIRAVADWLREQRPATKSQYTLEEWRNFVRNSFADPLAALDPSATGEEISKNLKKAIEAAVDAPKTVPILFMTIGCTLFEEPLPAPLAIGPVLFEANTDWLARAEKSGQITPTIRKRLERAFTGRTLAKPKDHRQRHQEDAILDVLKPSKVVCTVETRDLAPAMAEARGVIGARLALTALALFWERPSSALDGFHLSVDPGMRKVARLFSVPSGRHIAGGSRFIGRPHGPSVRPRSLAEFIDEARDLLSVAGRMIECWTSSSAYEQATSVQRILAQSLFFFSEGCREENNLMSIVKFVAALEALSQGKKATKIAALLKARIHLRKNTKIYADRDIDGVVDWLYSKHRSRTLHGTNPDILHDWSDARSLAEAVAHVCLVACMEWVIQNPTESDPNKLFN